MLGQTQALLEAVKLTQRVSAEGAVNLHGDEGLPLGEQPLADGIDGPGAGQEQHLESVRIGAQRLAYSLASGPVRRAAVGAHEILRRGDQALGPGEREREDAPVVDVRVGVSEAPGVRAHRRVQHYARP